MERVWQSVPNPSISKAEEVYLMKVIPQSSLLMLLSNIIYHHCVISCHAAVTREGSCRLVLIG